MLVRVRGPVLGGAVHQGHPLNGSETGGVAPGFLIRLPPRKGRETTCGPGTELALREPAAGRAPPYSGCRVALTWLDRDLSSRVLEDKRKSERVYDITRMQQLLAGERIIRANKIGFVKQTKNYSRSWLIDLFLI